MAILSLMFLSILCCLLVTIIFISQASAANTTQNFHYFCDEINDSGNYTANSTYHNNLNTLLSTLTSNAEINYGFYNSSYGQNSDKVNAIGLCRGDLRQDECLSCLKDSIANLTQLCPNRKEAIGWYDFEICMLRYTNRSIFGVMENGRAAYYAYSMDNATNVDDFNKVVNNLLNSLKTTAASGDSRWKYAASNAPGPNYQTIYGLAQCTPDLSGKDCDNCLAQSIEQFPNCCDGRTGARYVRPSCNIRYETELFYDPDAPPLPPTSEGNNNTLRTTVAIVVPVVVVAVVTFICIHLRMRKPKKKFETREDDDEEIKITESLQFSFDTI